MLPDCFKLKYVLNCINRETLDIWRPIKSCKSIYVVYANNSIIICICWCWAIIVFFLLLINKKERIKKWKGWMCMSIYLVHWRKYSEKRTLNYSELTENVKIKVWNLNLIPFHAQQMCFCENGDNSVHSARLNASSIQGNSLAWQNTAFSIFRSPPQVELGFCVFIAFARHI